MAGIRRIPKTRALVTVTILIIGTFVGYVLFGDAIMPGNQIPIRNLRNINPVFVNSERVKNNEVTCQYPDFDPFHPDAMAYFERYPITHCKGKITITYYDGEAVRVNKTLKLKTHGKKKIECWYRNVVYQRHIYHSYGKWYGPFTDFLKVDPVTKPEYVHAQCKNQQGKTVSDMHHYITRAEFRKKAKPTAKDIFKENQLNIMLLGMDSISKFLFKRAMPKTRDYLLNTLNMVELRKYTKIGDNTFPNLLAILAGVYEKEPENWSVIEGFDALPFVWKDYKNAGYRTMYLTDRTDFNDFAKPPTDRFTLPLENALMKGKINYVNECLHSKNEVEMWLEYLMEFVRDSLFTMGRFWTLAMIKRPTHDIPNKATAVDERYLAVLKEMYETNLLNNTFLLFFSDHGPRLTNYRRTVLGSIEERAPIQFLYFPQWFKDKYPLHIKNLMINRDRLTTNFDIHATLKALLNVHEKSYEREESIHMSKRMPRGFSLFNEIPYYRTCEHADLDLHNCLCHGGVSVIDPLLMKEVGKHVVREINAITRPVKPKCVKLRLRAVMSMGLLRGYPGWSATYRIMLSTKPGNAEFEATVEYSVKAFVFKSLKTLGYISRINTYRGQSDCVAHDKTLRLYCFCENALVNHNNATDI